MFTFIHPTMILSKKFRVRSPTCVVLASCYMRVWQCYCGLPNCSNNRFLAPRISENWLWRFSTKSCSGRWNFLNFLLQKLRNQFSDMRGATKLLIAGLVVHNSTTRCQHNSPVVPRMLENWLCNFSEKLMVWSAFGFFRRSYRVSAPTYGLLKSCYLGIW